MTRNDRAHARCARRPPGDATIGWATLAIAMAVAGCAHPAIERRIILPTEADAKAYAEYQYAAAVRVGDTVYVSGIPAGASGGTEERARAAFHRLEGILTAAGASMDDVVELTTFHAAAKDTPAFLDEFTRILAVHREVFRNGYPAWTAVGTTTLLSGAIFELRAVAVAGAGKRTRIEGALPPRGR